MSATRAVAVAIIPAAGSGVRMGPGDGKVFRRLGGWPLLARAAECAAACERVSSLIVAVRAGDHESVEGLITDHEIVKPFHTVAGGDTRQDSVRACLVDVPEGVEFVVVHDAARPLATASLFDAVLEALESDGESAEGAIPVVPVADTVKRVAGGWVTHTIPRDEIAAAQTPQAFRTAVLRDAHVRAAAEGATFTDDAALVEWAGGRVRAVAGEPDNFKITTPSDLARAEAVFAGRQRGARRP